MVSENTVMSFDSLFEFEKALSEYTGAPYVVLTDCCTHAIELCFRYADIKQTQFPAHTYISVPMVLAQLGVNYTMTDQNWLGEYQFKGTTIWDSARRLERQMYRPGQMQCLSFGYSKPLELGRVGAILLDDSQAYQTLSMMRSDGRDLRIKPWQDQTTFTLGYHYCPTLEDCKQGLELLPSINEKPKTVAYPDCRKIKIAT